MGWRWLYITIGGLCFTMSLLRAFVVRSRESPKWLVASGRIDDAVDVLNSISQSNGSDHRVEATYFAPPCLKVEEQRSFKENIRRALELFKDPKKLRLMLCLFGLWGLVGIT